MNVNTLAGGVVNGVVGEGSERNGGEEWEIHLAFMHFSPHKQQSDSGSARSGTKKRERETVQDTTQPRALALEFMKGICA